MGPCLAFFNSSRRSAKNSSLERDLHPGRAPKVELDWQGHCFFLLLLLLSLEYSRGKNAMSQFQIHTVTCQTWALGKAAHVVCTQRHGRCRGGIRLHGHEEFAFEDQDDGKAPGQMVMDPPTPANGSVCLLPRLPRKTTSPFPCLYNPHRSRPHPAPSMLGSPFGGALCPTHNFFSFTNSSKRHSHLNADILCWLGTNLTSKALLLLLPSAHLKNPPAHLLAPAGSHTGFSLVPAPHACLPRPTSSSLSALSPFLHASAQTFS